MKSKNWGKAAFFGAVVLMASSQTLAQSNTNTNSKPEADNAKAAADAGDFQFFVGQRLWLATWDNSLLDAQVVIPNLATGIPVIKHSPQRALSNSTIVPLTSLGMRYKDWSLAATFMPQTKFNTDGHVAGDAVRRDESDISLGYSFTPYLVGSFVYKTGSVDQAATSRLTGLAGITGGYKIEGLLLGISGNAPLVGPLSLYGNFAFGPSRESVSAIGLNNPTYFGSYQISEIGLAYRLTDERTIFGFKSLSIQLGFRSQTVTLNDLTFGTFSATPSPTTISSDTKSLQSNTQGVIFGVVAAF